jgi:hypothetical protein
MRGGLRQIVHRSVRQETNIRQRQLLRNRMKSFSERRATCQTVPQGCLLPNPANSHRYCQWCLFAGVPRSLSTTSSRAPDPSGKKVGVTWQTMNK